MFLISTQLLVTAVVEFRSNWCIAVTTLIHLVPISLRDAEPPFSNMFLWCGAYLNTDSFTFYQNLFQFSPPSFMQHTSSFKNLKVKLFKTSSLYYMFRPASAIVRCIKLV
jgi:hypothetical protein